MDVLLETSRLIWRRLTGADAESVYILKLEMAEPNHLATLDDIRSRCLPNILAYYQQGYGFGYWAAIERATGELIGWFYFRSAPDQPSDTAIGYFLRLSAWGKGYATEGARALIRKGFTELQVKRVVATALAINMGSIRVMEKVGLRFEKRITSDDSGTKAVRYCLPAEEFNTTVSS